jgi:hypothetical protein
VWLKKKKNNNKRKQEANNNKEIQHEACQNYTHECENHMQHAKIMHMGVKISDVAAKSKPNQDFFGTSILVC